MSISSFFDPNRQVVSNITQADPAVVTTTQDHGYESGLLVRFFFPLNVGMNFLDNQVYEITVLSANSFSIPVNTENTDAFALGSTSQVPQVIPVGNISDSLIQSTANSGNISPEL